MSSVVNKSGRTVRMVVAGLAAVLSMSACASQSSSGASSPPGVEANGFVPDPHDVDGTIQYLRMNITPQATDTAADIGRRYAEVWCPISPVVTKMTLDEYRDLAEKSGRLQDELLAGLKELDKYQEFKNGEVASADFTRQTNENGVAVSTCVYKP